MALPTTRNHGGGARGLAQGPGREGGAVMTIERPMFPPRREASPFRVVAGIDFAPSPDQPEDRPGPTADHERILSPTCKNKRLRDRRHDAWRMADSIRDYWHAR